MIKTWVRIEAKFLEELFMWSYPEIDPVALALGPIAIHWYGLMYVIGFAAAWFLGLVRAKKSDVWDKDKVSDLLFYCALGVVLGGRFGYVLFYDFSGFIANPLSLFMVWQGGMSFHGGLIGVTIGMWLFARKLKISLFSVADFVAPLVTIGLFAGRIGNFINGELWGKITDSPLGMWVYDPVLNETVQKYPTQLLQAFLEGLVLFVLLWWYSSKPRPAGSVAGRFLIAYGVFRIVAEFFRMPDAHIGYLAGSWLTMGMVLSLPMILIGLGLMGWAYRQAPGLKKGKNK
jgi:phosphatidylglycerol:prolipoprotein diacylglycerol transferase